MKKLLGRLFVASLLVSVSTSAIYAQAEGERGNRGGERGQGRPGGFGGMRGGSLASLLSIPQVEQELKLDEAQKEEIATARRANAEEMGSIFGRPGQGGPGQDQGGRGRGGRGAMSDENRQKLEALATKFDEKISEILDPDQFRRLLGIYAQSNTINGLTHNLVAKEIGLSDAQVADIKKVQEELGAKLREVMTGGADFRSEETRNKMRAATEEISNKAVAVLSDEQKQKYEELKGAKFDLPQGGFGGGGFGGRGERGERGNRGNRGDR